MVAAINRAGTGVYNIFRCRRCGRRNEDHGDWFWATPACDVCSDCASAERVVIVRGKYSRPASNYDVDGRKLCDLERQRKKNQRRAIKKRLMKIGLSGTAEPTTAEAESTSRESASSGRVMQTKPRKSPRFAFPSSRFAVD